MRVFRIHPAVLVTVVATLVGAAPAAAVRYETRPLLWQRTAVSGYFGGGLPVGEFASTRIGDGNQESWPADYAIEIEHFAGRTWSLGFSAAITTYKDKTYPDLETHLNTWSGFFRVVIPTATEVRPYLRAGVGGVQVQFQDPTSRVKADTKVSFQAGAGLLWLPVRWLGLNAQALYYRGSTEQAYLQDNTNTIVGFDVKYFAFSGGVSLFFP
jgi:opacity protein-like surface antigen